MNHDSSMTSDLPVPGLRRDVAHGLLPLGVALLAAGFPAWYLQGTAGITAAVVAAVVCLAASLAATFVEVRLLAAGQPVAATLGSSLLRMALPFAFCIVLALKRGPHLETSAIGYLLVFYMITLAADTRHSLARLKSAVPAAKER